MKILAHNEARFSKNKKSIVLERSIFQVKLAMRTVLQVPILLSMSYLAKRYRLHWVQVQGRYRQRHRGSLEKNVVKFQKINLWNTQLQ